MRDERTILRFRHRLDKHKLADAILATVNDVLSSQGLLLKEGGAVDATLIAASVPPRTKTASATLRCIRTRRATNGASG